MYEKTFLFSKFIAPKMPHPIFLSLLMMERNRKKTGLSAFSTFLTKNHKRDYSQAILLYYCVSFAANIENKKGADRNPLDVKNGCLNNYLLFTLVLFAVLLPYQFFPT
jgi:hypothetical protein